MFSLNSKSKTQNPKQALNLKYNNAFLEDLDFGFWISKFRFKKSKPFLGFLSVMLFMLIISMGPELKAEEKPSLAILPFIVQKAEDPARGAVCSVCKGIHRSNEVVPGSQNILTQILYGKLEALGTFTVLPSGKVEEARAKGNRNRFETDPISASTQLGKELNADFVMVGTLFRFEERIGSSLGVEKPASVAFDLHLFRLRDGARVWDATFDETQKPLSDNLFQIGSFFRSGAKWLTAEELAGVGINEVLKKLPEVKELQEKP
jgi:hypothetical protein